MTTAVTVKVSACENESHSLL